MAPTEDMGTSAAGCCTAGKAKGKAKGKAESKAKDMLCATSAAWAVREPGARAACEQGRSPSLAMRLLRRRSLLALVEPPEVEFLEGAAAVLAPPQVPPKSPEVESPEVEFHEDAAALTDGEEDDGEETEDLGSGVQKKPAAGWCVAERERPSSTRVSASSPY